MPIAIPARRNAKAQTHAIAHCPTAMTTADFPPSSLFTEAIAATHGVYSRQKTSRLPAVSGVIAARRFAVFPNSTDSVDTTLSLAINPVISAVEKLPDCKQ